MEQKIRQLIPLAKNLLNYIKTDLEDYLDDSELPNSSTYVKTIKAINIVNELEQELEEIEKSKYSSEKFKQKNLFDENKQ